MKLLYLSVIVVLYCLGSSTAAYGTNCEKIDSCSCKFDNGTVINLEPLGNKDGTAKFQDIRLDKNNSSSLFFNPCKPFNDTWPINDQGFKNRCQNVAACVHANTSVEVIPHVVVNYGKQESVTFATLESDQSLLIATYNSHKILQVTFICNPLADTPTFDAPTIDNKTQQIDITMTTKVACGIAPLPTTSTVPPTTDIPSTPIPSPEPSGLSSGSIFLIILLVIVLVYVLGGCLYNKIVAGAHGAELFPHLPFWTSIPGLAFDGIRFMCGCCRSRHSTKQYNDI